MGRAGDCKSNPDGFCCWSLAGLILSARGTQDAGLCTGVPAAHDVWVIHTRCVVHLSRIQCFADFACLQHVGASLTQAIEAGML
jgi:hypothetical protein